MSAKSFQLCPALCDLTDCNLPGSVVRGILQARILGWVAMRSARGSFQSKDQSLVCHQDWQEGSLPQVPPGKPFQVNYSSFVLLCCTFLNIFTIYNLESMLYRTQREEEKASCLIKNTSKMLNFYIYIYIYIILTCIFIIYYIFV